MIIALGDVHAQIPRVGRVRELMRATQERVRREPGCIAYAFAEALDEPGHFLIVQRWIDQRALDHHFRSEAFADYQAQVADLLISSSELHIHMVSATYSPVDSAPMDPRQAD